MLLEIFRGSLITGMSVNDHGFVEWEEHIICHERGNRVIHFHLKDGSGDTVLAVIGTERSVRHMTYVVSDEFMRLAGVEKSVNACMKWRARREVVEWLTSLVSRHRVPYSDISSTYSINCSSRCLNWNLKFSDLLLSSYHLIGVTTCPKRLSSFEVTNIIIPVYSLQG